MKAVIVTATVLEVGPFLDRWGIATLPLGELVTGIRENSDIGIIRCGVGMMTTAYYLGNLLNRINPELLIQVGVAGSFDIDLDLGQVVTVKDQQYGDCGVLSGGMLWDIFDLNLAGLEDGPFGEGRLSNPKTAYPGTEDLPCVSGVSVNRISTEPEEIELIRMKYRASIESMEGIAFHYSCLDHNVPYIELRGISNYVGERDKARWKMEEAVQNINSKLVDILQ